MDRFGNLITNFAAGDFDGLRTRRFEMRVGGRRIHRVALEGMLISYDSVETHRIQRQIFEQVVPSALKYFDFPDLIAALAPRPVWLVSPVNGLGHSVPATELRNAYAAASRAFKVASAEQQLHVKERRPGDQLFSVYADLVHVAAGSPRN